MVGVEDNLCDEAFDRLESLKDTLESESGTDTIKRAIEIKGQIDLLDKLGADTMMHSFNPFFSIDLGTVDPENPDKAYIAFLYNTATVLVNCSNFRVEGLKTFLNKIFPGERPTTEEANQAWLELLLKLDSLNGEGEPNRKMIYHLDFQDNQPDQYLLETFLKSFSTKLPPHMTVLISGVELDDKLKDLLDGLTGCAILTAHFEYQLFQ